MHHPRHSLAIIPLLVLGLAGCTSVGSVGAAPDEPAPSSTSAIPTQPPVSAPSGAEPTRASSPDPGALATLATIPVKGRAPATGYARTTDFGTAWLDVDHNGCDTRNDILARDLSGVVRSGPCTVLSGTLVSPYTGATIAFKRGQTTSTLVQIDHIVALEDAWQTGAQQLPQEQREALANDPLNLFAVDQSSNEQKRAGDAATWLPANRAFRCEYVTHQIDVKAKYGLWVTAAEHDAMVRVLGACGSVPASGPSAPPAAAPAPSSVSYANCDAVRAAGAAPLHADDPGYSRALDRDGDGVACE